MSDVVLSDILLAKLAGWEAVKTARILVAGDRVLSSEWQPPLLRGTVQQGTSSFRAGLVIKSASDAENLCPCRESRERGMICAHSVAVGLHFLKSQTPAAPAPSPSQSRTVEKSVVAAKPRPPAKTLKRAAVGEAGLELQINLILPPNLSDALARNKIMLYCEAQWRGGRAPLDAIPRDEAFSLSPEDTALLNAFEALNEGDTPSMLMLTVPQLVKLLPLCEGNPRVTLGKSAALEVSGEPLNLRINATLEAGGDLSLRLAETLSGAVLQGAEGVWVFRANTLRPANLPKGLEELSKGAVKITRNQIPLFLNLVWPALAASGNVSANFKLVDFLLETQQPAFRLHLAGGLAMLEARLEGIYGNQVIAAGAPAVDGVYWQPDPANPRRYWTRDVAAEQLALGRLLKQGFAGPDAKGLLHLKGQNEVLNFFAREFQRLEKEWKVTLEERLERSTQQNIERIEPRFQITPSGEQWFDLGVEYSTQGGERFAAADIQRLLLSGQSHSRLKNGKFAIIDSGAVEELQEVLLDCAPRQHAGGYRLDNRQSGFLEATLRQQPGWSVQAPSSWTQRAAKQRGDVKLETPPLGSLDSVLRPYQKEGVGWLHFLRSNSFGGILADEMGLGKTLQVLALLESLRFQGQLRGPVLVVCPTSLVFNWLAEAAKFTPGLKVLALHGQRRLEMIKEVSACHLVVTSYGSLRRDFELYRGLDFDTVVLDEAQHIKNRQTQNAQAVKSVRSAHRLVLTGTPLENSVLDLWSIFDFLMPGYLGNPQDFRERYEGPIVKEKDLAAQTRLSRRLRPFMLRRLKREVAADLPEKIELVSYCEMAENQRALYQQVLDASRREILAAEGAQAQTKGRMLVLTTLLRLRQICCDPRLLKLESKGAKPEISGKVELFGELLEEVIDGGHRALVFSQFTSMLALLQEELASRNLEFCYLDGETRDRAAVVARFQNDSRIPVFLISLKAGGVGLNLTGADTVIHFDPWWNPATEAQATDRAHRIGQQKVVTSYKLITRGSVEEKILNLQARKKALFQGMLGGEEDLVGALNWEEIQDLLTA